MILQKMTQFFPKIILMPEYQLT